MLSVPGLLAVSFHCSPWFLPCAFTVQGQPRIGGQFVCRFLGFSLLWLSSFCDSLLIFRCFGNPELHAVTMQGHKTAIFFLSSSCHDLCVDLEVHSEESPMNVKLSLSSFLLSRVIAALISVCFCERVSLVQDTQPLLELEHNFFLYVFNQVVFQ